MRKVRRDFVKNNPTLASQANGKIQKFILQEIQSLPQGDIKIISGYWPMANEVDIVPVFDYLHQQNYKITLPISSPNSSFLTFSSWYPGVTMVEDFLGFHYPENTEKDLTPDLLLVPVVAFDKRGYRLGYGKGFYDKTMDFLHQHDPHIRTLGVAFSIQGVDELYAEPHDLRLDAVVTEEGIIRF